MNEKPTSVIFDLDGVLINSMEVMKNAYIESCRQVLKGEIFPPFSEYCKYLGRSLPEILRIMGLPQEIRPVFIEQSYQQMAKIKMFDGIREVLAILHEKQIPMAIATGKEFDRTRAILKHLGIYHYFSKVVCSDRVSKPKPSPEMANIIIDELGLTAQQCLFVGDAAADIQCGKQAGTQTALALWGDPDVTVLNETADYRLNDPLELLELVEAECYA
ncbi:phosphoglycolate phosphatase [Vibrio crassostreae]|nr:phosphoglycolate phosphatase [Vibrio crassostreae]CAK2773469.1 phosphoglycolate phosphatase [Vibrio crassostreae]CAK3218817.1 phosphoglycolate phosphatase [Vibrio crassostreae]CAK3841007.1 phosphoglycolate phosphatase [Vibrio crassostreae]